MDYRTKYIRTERACFGPWSKERGIYMCNSYRFNGSMMKYPYPLEIVNGGSWIIERSIFVRSALVSSLGVKNEVYICVMR